MSTQFTVEIAAGAEFPITIEQSRQYNIVARPGWGGTGSGGTGAAGKNGWSPQYRQAIDGSRVVLELYDWFGGTGTKPTTLGYVGLTGIVLNIADAVDISGTDGVDGTDGSNGANGIDGQNGTDGIDGADGNNGWSPIFSLVARNNDTILKIIDWTGGEGTKPAIDVYVGLSGLSTDIADGINIKGPAGADGANGTDGIDGINGIDGTDGTNGADGWSPIFSIVPRNNDSVLKIIDWAGGSGTKPDINLYVGLSGLSENIANAINIAGPQGLQGPQGLSGQNGTNGTNGTDGTNGWSPVFSIISRNNDEVLQVSDWTGGSGTKPATGQYVSATGFTENINNAVNIKGATGATGSTGATGNIGPAGPTGPTTFQIVLNSVAGMTSGVKPGGYAPASGTITAIKLTCLYTGRPTIANVIVNAEIVNQNTGAVTDICSPDATLLIGSAEGSGTPVPNTVVVAGTTYIRPNVIQTDSTVLGLVLCITITP